MAAGWVFARLKAPLLLQVGLPDSARTVPSPKYPGSNAALWDMALHKGRLLILSPQVNIGSGQFRNQSDISQERGVRRP